MSEEVFDLESPKTIFRFKGQDREPIAIDVIEAQEAMEEIEKKQDKHDSEHPDSPPLPQNWKLERFAEWLVTAGYPIGTFKKGELDSLWAGVLAAFLKKKKAQSELLASIQSSPISMEGV